MVTAGLLLALGFRMHRVQMEAATVRCSSAWAACYCVSSLSLIMCCLVLVTYQLAGHCSAGRRLHALHLSSARRPPAPDTSGNVIVHLGCLHRVQRLTHCITKTQNMLRSTIRVRAACHIGV